MTYLVLILGIYVYRFSILVNPLVIPVVCSTSKTAGISTEKRDDLSRYIDRKNVSEYAQDAVRWASAQGLLADRTDQRIGAWDKVTHADYAFIMNAYQNISDNE